MFAVLLISSLESFLQLCFVLFIFVAVLVMTRYATKWIAGYQKVQMSGRNLEIVETLRLSSNKYLAVVRAGEDRYFVIGVGKDEVTAIGELSAEEVKAFAPVAKQNSDIRSAQSFGAALDMFKKQFDKSGQDK